MDEKRKAGRTGRAAARPARVALAHATGVLLAIVAVFSLFSVRAYALPGSEKNGYPLGEILMSENVGANRGTAVYGAANEFFATLCLIGRKSDYLQLSSDQLAELSNEGTGGAFYELSQRWSNYATDGAPTDWPVGITLAIEGQGLISDPAYIWYADYSYYETGSLYQRALADYQTIYDGGHLGSTGASGDTFTFNFGNFYYDLDYSNNQYIDKAYRPFACTLQLSQRAHSLVESNLATYPYVVVFATSNNNFNNNFNGINRVQLRLSKTPFTFTYNSNNEPVSNFGDCLFYNVNLNIANGGSAVLDFASSNLRPANGSNNFAAGSCFWASTLNTVPVIPPSNWPDPEPTPEPGGPSVPEPEPGGPGIEPPDPYNPIVEPTPDPDPITDPYVVVVAPDSSDIVEWLRAILRAINNVGDKLNAESTELQNALNKTFFNNLSKLLKNLKGEFIQDYTSWLDKELEWFNSEIHDYFVDLQNYLYRLFDWLADQMNFEFDVSTDPYDDTSLLNWLRRIYNKLGADGGPNTRPVDPSTDPEGFLDWLRRMIAEFILGLGASASDFVSDLGDLLSRLFAKFPFSVPWDLLGILGLLDAAPVAPRANFTIPLTIGNSSFSWTIDINLTSWSTYMESVRTIILVSFISWLAWLTPNVLRDLDPGDFL